MNLVRILDIDLDFFVQADARPERTIDRSMNTLKIWSKDDVKSFLEKNCGLSSLSPINGFVFEHHDEAFHYCKKIIENSDPDTFLSIDHVDAHADLGGYEFDVSLLKIIRELPCPFEVGWLTKRQEEDLGLNPGNFLAFLLAQGWLYELNYINYPEWLNDLPPILFEKGDISTNKIFFKYFLEEDLTLKINFEKGIPLLTSLTNFYRINYRLFNNCRTYDYVFLTKSPDYSPLASDSLIPTIQKFINVKTLY
jgi:hypothetical protein